MVKLVSCAQRATRLSLFPSHPTVPALPQGVCDKDTGVQPTHFRDPMSFMITLLLHIILAGRACDPRVSIAGVTFKAYRRRLYENVLWRGRRAAHVGRESTQRRRRCRGPQSAVHRIHSLACHPRLRAPCCSCQTSFLLLSASSRSARTPSPWPKASDMCNCVCVCMSVYECVYFKKERTKRAGCCCCFVFGLFLVLLLIGAGARHSDCLL